MVENKGMYVVLHGELKSRIKRTKNFWPERGFEPQISEPKFEFLGRLDLSILGFLELLDFTSDP